MVYLIRSGALGQPALDDYKQDYADDILYRDEVQRIWESNGIGWFTETFDSRLENCVRVRFYHGSSLYDTKQMSRLIDYIVDEAHALGIETETEENIRRMIESWSKE